MAKKIVAMVMLAICPTTRIVAADPEASPNWFLSTELIIVFIFGDEKRANPNPTQNNKNTIAQMGVDSLKNANAASPKVQIVMPIVAK
jgi:hypothetical protein